MDATSLERTWPPDRRVRTATAARATTFLLTLGLGLLLGVGAVRASEASTAPTAIATAEPVPIDTAARADDGAPDGDRPALFVGTVSTAKDRSRGGAWLDSTGEVLALDDFETSAMAVCPGEHRVVQVTATSDDDAHGVRVRDLRTLELIERFDLSAGVTARAVTCRDEAATEVIIAGQGGIIDARSGERLVDIAFDPESAVSLSPRLAVGFANGGADGVEGLAAVDLETREVMAFGRFAFDVALDGSGDRIAMLVPTRRGEGWRLVVMGPGSSEDAGSVTGLVELARRGVADPFAIRFSDHEGMDAPMYLAWLDDRIALIRSQRADVTRPGRGRVLVLDGQDLSVVCRWRGWNVAPLASTDGVLLGIGGPFRTVKRMPEDRQRGVLVWEPGRRETWRIGSSLSVRDAAGDARASVRVPGAEPSGLVVPLPGFDAETLLGERPSGCQASTSAEEPASSGAGDIPSAGPDSTRSRRLLEDELLTRVAPIECERWREEDRPFEFGAKAAIQCEEPVTGIAQLALFTFPDTQALQDFWAWRVGQLELAPATDDPACADGQAGVATVEHGAVACYVQRGVAKIRWIDERTGTYGVLDAAGDDLAALQARWDIDDPSSLAPAVRGEIVPLGTEASRLPRAPARVTVTSLMKGGQERGPGYGITDVADVGPPATTLTGFRLDVRWRDRSDDEVGFRVVRFPVRAACRGRSLVFEPTGGRVLIERVPADSTRWEGFFETNSQDTVYAEAWRIAVMAFNKAGASKAAVAGDDDVVGSWQVPRRCR